MNATRTVSSIAAAGVMLLSGCAGGPDAGLMPGDEIVLEGVLQIVDAQWWYTPLFFESAPVCPVPDETPLLRTSHHAHVLRVAGDVRLDATLERPGWSAGSDTALVLYDGSSVPGSPAAARDCLAMEYASGPFPGEISDVPLDAGSTFTAVISNLPGEGPIDYRLVVRARER